MTYETLSDISFMRSGNHRHTAGHWQLAIDLRLHFRCIPFLITLALAALVCPDTIAIASSRDGRRGPSLPLCT